MDHTDPQIPAVNMIRRPLALLFSFIFFYSVASFLWQNAATPPLPTIAIVVCGHTPSTAFAQQLHVAIQAAVTNRVIHKAKVYIRDTTSTPVGTPAGTSPGSSTYSCLGRTFQQSIQDGKDAADYVVLLVVSDTSVQIANPDTLFQTIVANMQTVDVLGISTVQQQPSASVVHTTHTLDDAVWWRTGRPAVASNKMLYSKAFNNKEWEESYTLRALKKQNPYTARAATRAATTSPTIRVPCWLLHRVEWTLRIVPSPTLQCEAMGSAVVLRAAVLQQLQDVLWPSLATTTSPPIQHIDAGLLHFWMTLKRTRYQQLNVQHVGSGLIASQGPSSMFDQTSTAAWFTLKEGQQRRQGSATSPLASFQRKDSPRQHAFMQHIAFHHDLRELIDPSQSLLNMGCSQNSHRCSMQFVQRGFSLPPCCRHKLLLLLTFVSRLFTAHNILHWIDYGTLLGAVRHHNQFIPWEYDADVTVWSEHWPAVQSLETKFKEAGHFYFLQTPGFARIFTSTHNGIYVDIYTAGRVQHENPNAIYLVSAGNIDPFDISHLQPMETIVLEGEVFPCPNNVASFIETRYGAGVQKNVKKKLYDGPVSTVDAEKYGPDPIDFARR